MVYFVYILVYFNEAKRNTEVEKQLKRKAEEELVREKKKALQERDEKQAVKAAAEADTVKHRLEPERVNREKNCKCAFGCTTSSATSLGKPHFKQFGKDGPFYCGKHYLAEWKKHRP